MRFAAPFFALIGLCAVGAAWLQPDPLSPLAERARIQAAMESRGYVASALTNTDTPVPIMNFSSRACGNVRVLPVSVLFQETVLLRQAENAGDQRTYIYRDAAWKNAAQGAVALSHLSQKFLQMTRLRPDPAIDTMLYVVAPRTCGPTAIDWSQFWSHKTAI